MAFNKVLRLKSWNNEQKAVFDLATKLKGGFSLVEGFPGCGKSTTLAALAIIYYLSGLHVLIVGPSNASVDAATQKLVTLMGDIEDFARRDSKVRSLWDPTRTTA